MTERFDGAYIRARAKREEDYRKRLADAGEAALAAEAAAAPPPKDELDMMGTEKKPSPGIMRETARVVVGAPLDAATSVVRLWDESASLLEGAYLRAREFMGGRPAEESERTAWRGPLGGGAAGDAVESAKQAVVSDSQSTGGRIARSIGQFVVPFLGAYKAMGAAGAFGKSAFMKGTAAGVATDFAAFEADEGRLTDLLAGWAKENPTAAGRVLEWMNDRDPNSPLTERAKSAVEGAFIGGIAEGIFAAFKTYRAYKQAKGVDPAEEIAKKAQAMREAEEAAQKTALEKRLEAEKARMEAAMAEPGARAAGAKAAKQVDAAASTRAAREGKAAEIAAEADRLTKEAEEQAAKEAPAKQRELDVETVIANAEKRWEEATNGVLVKETRFVPAEQNIPGMIELLLRRPGATRGADDIILLRNYADLAKEAEDRLIADGVLPPRETPKIEVPQSAGGGARSASDTNRIAAAVAEDSPTGVPPKLDSTVRGAAEVAASARESTWRIAQVTGLGRTQGGFANPTLLAQIAAGGLGAAIGYEQGGAEGALAGLVAGVAGGAVLGKAVNKAAAAKEAAKATPEKVTAFKQFLADAVDTESMHFARDADDLKVTAKPAPKRSPRISTQSASNLADALIRGDLQKAADEANSWINWNYVQTGDDAKQLMLQMEEAFAQSINRVGSKRMSDVQVVALADAMGMNLKQLKALNEDVAALAPRLLAARTFSLAASSRFLTLARTIQTGGAGMSIEAAVLAARKQMHLAGTAMAYVKGTVSEVARALRQQQIMAKAPQDMYREGLEILQSVGGLEANLEALRKLATLELEQLPAAAEKFHKATTLDMFNEVFINGLLSGPVTHTVNALSNILVAVSGVSEKTFSAAVGAITRSKDRTTFGEVGAQMVGMMAGIRDAMRITARGAKAAAKATAAGARGQSDEALAILDNNAGELGSAWQSFFRNEPIIDAVGSTKLENSIKPAITAKQFNLAPNSVAGRAVDVLGGLLRMPGRALMTADELFKAMHMRGQLHAQAYREAMGQGLKGQDLVDEMARIIHDPSDEIMEIARTEARYRTFTTELDGLGASIQKDVINHPWLRMILPFVRTPVNIMKYSFERLGLSKQLWSDLKAGGARRELALGKLSTTGLIAAGYAQLAAEGRITGGGEKQSTAEEVGRAPRYSVLIDGTWYDYSRLEPLGSVLGMMVDGFDLMGPQQAGEADVTAMGIVATVARNVTSRTYLQGLVEFFDAISSGNEQAAQRFFQQTVGGAVPFSSALATVTREMDPEMKDTRDTVDYLKSRLPWSSDEIPPHRDIFANPVPYRAGLGPDWLSPIRLMEQNPSPAAQEIARLDIDLQRPPRTLDRGKGVGVELTPKEYDGLLVSIGKTKMGGKNLQEALEALVASDRYTSIPDAPGGPFKGMKQMMIERTYNAYRQAGTIQFLRDNEGVRRRYEGNRQNALNTLLGREVVPMPAPE